MELRDLVSGVTLYFDPLAIFHKPLHLAINDAFFNVGFNIRVNAKGNALFVLLN